MARKPRQPESPTTRAHPRDRGAALSADELVVLSRRVTNALRSPVVGGIAVVLHGGGRHTSDIDIKLRKPFKELVEQVHGPRRATLPTPLFWKKYA